MINLLPKEYEQNLGKEYGIRRLIVIVGFVTVLVFISAVLLFPAYFLARIREKNILAQSDALEQKTNGENDVSHILQNLAVAAKNGNELENKNNHADLYTLIHILQTKSPSVKISNISYSNKPKEAATFVINGIAKDRDSLTQFQQFISSQNEFSAVDLPISSFAKETDIAFSLTATVRVNKS